MLHISDIEKRLKLCPEPPEVTEMREKIESNAETDLEIGENYIKNSKINIEIINGKIKRNFT